MNHIRIVFTGLLALTACDLEDDPVLWNDDTGLYARTSFETAENAPECPDLWRLPMDCENKALDGRIKLDGSTYDVDLDMKTSTENKATGVFDGPYTFNGSFSASVAKDHTQTVSIDANGMGHSMDITLTMDPNCKATVKGTVNGVAVDQSVKIGGSGELDDPLSVTIDGVTMEWATACGEIDTTAAQFDEWFDDAR